MIGRLSGILLSKQPSNLVVDVNGVGYDVESPISTFYELPAEGNAVTLLIHTHVREDAIQLYGFATDIERRFFRALIKISGVGTKMALVILSGVSAQNFAQLIEHEDYKTLTKLPGVGIKTAQRLVIEMRDKLDKDVLCGDVALPNSTLKAGQLNVSAPSESPESEAVNALVGLGYKPAEASKMVKTVYAEGEQTESLIRKALQNTIA